MFLKTLKTQLAAGMFLGASLVALPAVAAPIAESDYCQCVAECGGDTGCWDWCALVHMQTLCKSSAPVMVMDRR